jgi:hypothetical protein
MSTLLSCSRDRPECPPGAAFGDSHLPWAQGLSDHPKPASDYHLKTGQRE